MLLNFIYIRYPYCLLLLSKSLGEPSLTFQAAVGHFFFFLLCSFPLHEYSEVVLPILLVDIWVVPVWGFYEWCCQEIILHYVFCMYIWISFRYNHGLELFGHRVSLRLLWNILLINFPKRLKQFAFPRVCRSSYSTCFPILDILNF